MKKIIATDNAPKAVGPYSQAVEVNGTLYISGQIPLNPKTMSVVEGIEEQAAQCLKNIDAILTAAGYTKENVVKTTILLDDINNFSTINQVYASYFTTDMPARACYQVAKLPMGVAIEIEAIAVK